VRGAGGLLAAALALAAPAGAKVFYTQQEALALAFPEAERVEPRNWVLTDEQAGRIEALSRSKLDSRLVRAWRASRGDAILGWALIDVRIVRTHAEAFMVVLTPEGKVGTVRMLAFHEPLDYLPPDRWYEQFASKTQGDPLRVGGDIHGITGASLSARATTDGVRRALAIHQVLLAGER
jgi:hypothetical protein